ncbi:MlaD family protein [uncultured Flavobacterium sp.]|uniref:MlaD family protein n=1 Tax=uncultured Flavobacterium sp. TaxID=165435 RepID=UPI0030ECC122
MKLSREIKTAILVISSILLFIWGYSFLKGKDLFVNYKTLYIKYDNVEGLETSSMVSINGKTVGKVIAINLDKNWKSIVEIQIDGDYDIAKSSIAQIYAPSPIGGKQIAILPGEGTPTVEDGDFLQSSSKLGLTEELSSQLIPLKNKIDVLLDNANKMLVNMNQLLDVTTQANLKSSISELNKTLIEFSQMSKSANQMLAENKSKLSSTLTNFDKTSSNFAAMSDSLAKANLGQTVKNLEKTLSSVDKIMSDVESGKGTMGKLMKDDKMYTNFTNASKELELLLEDLRLHPTRYINVSVFGKKNKPYVAPIEEELTKE